MTAAVWVVAVFAAAVTIATALFGEWAAFWMGAAATVACVMWALAERRGDKLQAAVDSVPSYFFVDGEL